MYPRIVKNSVQILSLGCASEFKKRIMIQLYLFLQQKKCRFLFVFCIKNLKSQMTLTFSTKHRNKNLIKHLILLLLLPSDAEMFSRDAMPSKPSKYLYFIWHCIWHLYIGRKMLGSYYTLIMSLLRRREKHP